MKCFLVDNECLCREDGTKVSEGQVTDLSPHLSLTVSVLPSPEGRPYLEPVEVRQVVLDQATLGVQDSGLGVRRSADVAYPAFIASCVTVRPFLERLCEQADAAGKRKRSNRDTENHWLTADFF